jgi:ABC-2 type transport system ATP-binding protein
MINVNNLRKTYGDVVAVDDVSFEAKKGDVLGFIGPNGAGKTTTLRMLSCFIGPDSGSATVGGFDIVAQPVEVRRCMGYVPEKSPFYGEMTPRWFLKFVCDVRGINGTTYRSEIERVAAISSLQGVMGRRTTPFQKGSSGASASRSRSWAIRPFSFSTSPWPVSTRIRNRKSPQ